MKNNYSTQKYQSGIALLVVIAIVAILGGIGTYAVVTQKSKLGDHIDTIQTNENAQINQIEEIPVSTSATTTLDIASADIVSVPKSTTVLAPIGDYEVRILSPLPNATLYTGQTINIKVQVGKYVSKLSFLSVGPDLVKDVASVGKASDGTLTFDYTIKPAGQILSLGDTELKVSGMFSPDIPKGVLPTVGEIEKMTTIIPLIIDTHDPIASLDLGVDPIIVKVGTKSDVQSISETHGVGVVFQGHAVMDPNDHGAVMVGDSLASFTIADESVAKLDTTMFSSISRFLFPAIIVEGLKVGKTTLTVTYKNVSKTIGIEVTN